MWSASGHRTPLSIRGELFTPCTAYAISQATGAAGREERTTWHGSATGYSDQARAPTGDANGVGIMRRVEIGDVTTRVAGTATELLRIAFADTNLVLPVAILPQGLRLVFRTLCSELLYVQPAAMSVPHQAISINKTEYGFVYTYMGSGIYKCRRCSEWGDKDSEVLWLMKGGNNVWYAFDAPKDPLPTSVPTDDKVILKSYPEFDALLPGIHKWTAMRAEGGPRLAIYETFLIDD